jgi:hypothetical protein
MLTLSSSTDGEQLVRLKRSNEVRFEKLVNWYRQQGVSDSEIVKAMADARGMISPWKVL